MDLTLANPTRAGLIYPETLVSSWSNAAALQYEPEPRGLRATRAVLADWYGERHLDVTPDDLVLTASTSEGYGYLFKLLCDPGDRVLVPCPSYPLFEHLAGLEGVHADKYTWRDAGCWVLDDAELMSSVGPRTRAIIVVAPNNPTGSMPTDAEWRVLANICRRHGLALIIDEVFAAYSLIPGLDAIDTPAPPDVLTFRLSGLSKLIGLPQAKLAWIAVHGPAGHKNAALTALDLITDTYLSVSTPVQLALPALLEAGAGVRAQIQSRVRANLHALASRVIDTTVDVRWPDGGWSAVLRVPVLGGPDTLVLALLDRGVIAHPGYFYDLPHDGYLVVSLIVPESDLLEGIDALTSLLSPLTFPL